jgi:hypothetical protein
VAGGVVGVVGLVGAVGAVGVVGVDVAISAEPPLEFVLMRNFWLTQGRECSQHLQPLPETVADVYGRVAGFSWLLAPQIIEVPLAPLRIANRL